MTDFYDIASGNESKEVESEGDDEDNNNIETPEIPEATADQISYSSVLNIHNINIQPDSDDETLLATRLANMDGIWTKKLNNLKKGFL